VKWRRLREATGTTVASAHRNFLTDERELRPNCASPLLVDDEDVDAAASQLSQKFDSAQAGALRSTFHR
jgi:hypothetical protein